MHFTQGFLQMLLENIFTFT